MSEDAAPGPEEILAREVDKRKHLLRRLPLATAVPHAALGAVLGGAGGYFGGGDERELRGVSLGVPAGAAAGGGVAYLRGQALDRLISDAMHSQAAAALANSLDEHSVGSMLQGGLEGMAGGQRQRGIAGRMMMGKYDTLKGIFSGLKGVSESAGGQAVKPHVKELVRQFGPQAVKGGLLTLGLAGGAATAAGAGAGLLGRTWEPHDEADTKIKRSPVKTSAAQDLVAAWQALDPRMQRAIIGAPVGAALGGAGQYAFSRPTMSGRSKEQALAELGREKSERALDETEDPGYAKRLGAVLARASEGVADVNVDHPGKAALLGALTGAVLGAGGAAALPVR